MFLFWINLTHNHLFQYLKLSYLYFIYSIKTYDTLKLNFDTRSVLRFNPQSIKTVTSCCSIFPFILIVHGVENPTTKFEGQLKQDSAYIIITKKLRRWSPQRSMKPNKGPNITWLLVQPFKQSIVSFTPKILHDSTHLHQLEETTLFKKR